MPRVFFGLELPPEITERLMDIRSDIPGAKWQSASQLHITLLFLGSVEEAQLTALCDSARDIRLEPFSLQIKSLGCFGSPQTPRNLWAGVQPREPLARLRASLQGRVEELGFVCESRKFCPHITLSRFKRDAGSVEALLAENGERAFGQFPVTEFALFDSTPGQTGSVYRVIERFTLQVSPL
ncbi:RNA 2',3'-cyclic phosphodiesterase [Marinobacter sp. CHS3-4]|uniref:RNA 2',3'-cyclic phosphodiesterase n=1 Tax=Marinobacter sp. CHS3-4 TaxID=3045174 RepID=UPI0024B53BA1|nr:RNA 2',3'-cyclic phosphodiesterase [Marinobacter sp. CHS3-4]MDI9244648.1 RNA 2',3'-cyclic phosphodiesterase [Marinobacter sp. CHS3-4]